MDTKIHQNTATSGEVEKFGQLMKEHDNEGKSETIKVALDGKHKFDDVIIGLELKKSLERHGKPKIPGEDPNSYHVNVSLVK
mmetsp:Transcript_29886/g.28574  ORF Transcript_29886/g.28574 Transcript_29886/m.28574 type:complete len:82 (+) Transcript_29886:56-301(+)